MAVFRIRKRARGGFTVVGTLGDNSNLVSREVREVADLTEAAEAVEEIASAFVRRRPNARPLAGPGK